MKAFLACAGVLLASCGPKSLELPVDPVDRAATCGAVAAASARVATQDINATLSIDAIGRVLHYPMLAGAEGGSFSSATAKKVQDRMAELQDKVSGSKWQELIPQCRAAYPATAIETVTLPADRYEAQLGCDELGDFLRAALAKRGKYDNELADYYRLGSKLEPKVSPGLRSLAGTDPRMLQQERNKALAGAARLGPPVAVMNQCMKQFG